MITYHKRALPESFAVLSGPFPPDDLAFKSDRIQILWNCSNAPWADPGQHLHTDSDEAYIVLSGALVLEIENERVTVASGEVCFVPAGVFHAVVEVYTPIKAFVIRSPATQDKVQREEAPLPR